MRSFLAYLRRPRAVEPHDRSPRWWTALKLLLIDFALLVPLGGVAYLASEGIDDETFIADDGISLAGLIVLGVVVAPLVEESAFRLAVTRFRPAFLITSGVLLTLFAADTTVSVAQVLLVPALGLLVMGVAGISAERRERLEAWWERRFAWVFYGSAVAFGLVHLFNYDLGVVGGADLSLAPLLIAPQIAGGLVLAYVRVRLGFAWAVANHATYNALLTLPALFGA